MMKKAGKAKGGAMGVKAMKGMKGMKAMKGGEMGDMMPVAMPPMSKKGGKSMAKTMAKKKMK